MQCHSLPGRCARQLPAWPMTDMPAHVPVAATAPWVPRRRRVWHQGRQKQDPPCVTITCHAAPIVPPWACILPHDPCSIPNFACITWPPPGHKQQRCHNRHWFAHSRCTATRASASSPSDPAPSNQNPHNGGSSSGSSSSTGGNSSTSGILTGDGSQPDNDATEAGQGGGGSGDGGKQLPQTGDSDGDSASGSGRLLWQSYPTWLRYWVWVTALVYLVARTRWRAERDEKRKELEREAQLEEDQAAEWERFVTDYTASAVVAAGPQSRAGQHGLAGPRPGGRPSTAGRREQNLTTGSS